jgi:hypothetical protein
MGLKVSYSELDPANQTDVQVIDSVMPFSFSSEMHADVAVNLDWRHGNGPWHYTKTHEALVEINFSSRTAHAAHASKPVSAEEAGKPAPAENPDVARAIKYLCDMEAALDQWAIDNPAPKRGDDPPDLP